MLTDLMIQITSPELTEVPVTMTTMVTIMMVKLGNKRSLR